MSNPIVPLVSPVQGAVVQSPKKKRQSSIEETGEAGLQLSKRVAKKEFTPIFPMPVATASPLAGRDVTMEDQRLESRQRTDSAIRNQQHLVNLPLATPAIPAAASLTSFQQEENPGRVWKFEKPLEPRDFPRPSIPLPEPSPLITLLDGSTIQHLNDGSTIIRFPNGSSIQSMRNGMRIERTPDGKISVSGGGVALPPTNSGQPSRPPLGLPSARDLPRQLFSISASSFNPDPENQDEGDNSDDESVTRLTGLMDSLNTGRST